MTKWPSEYAFSVLLLISVFLLASCSQEGAAPIDTHVNLTGTSIPEAALGNADAPVTIIEYGSLTCDYCVHFHRKVFPHLKLRHIDQGRVRFIYRNFPTSEAAVRGAVAARCSGNHYYKMLDTLFSTVGSWSRAADVDAKLSEQGASIGIDEKSFRTCLSNPEHARTIMEGQQRAKTEHGVLGTPTFIINGKIFTGIRNIDDIEILIEEALNRTNLPRDDQP